MTPSGDSSGIGLRVATEDTGKDILVGMGSASTGVSPFFLSHGYHMEPLQLFEELGPVQSGKSPVQKADEIVRKMKEATEWAQMAMAVAQQAQEETANRKRQQSYDFKEGDKVWLNLKNVRTDRLCKKFDVKNAKYTIVKKISSHAFRLNTPPGIHNVFHSVMLRPAAEDPLPSQRTIDPQPPPHIVGEEDEYEVEEILKERIVQRRGGPKKKYLVKWQGYAKPTWEPASALEDTVALEKWCLAHPGAI